MLGAEAMRARRDVSPACQHRRGGTTDDTGLSTHAGPARCSRRDAAQPPGKPEQGATAASDLWQGEDWIFTNHVRGVRTFRADWDQWRALLASAGIKRRVRIHDLRHSAATFSLLPDRQ